MREEMKWGREGERGEEEGEEERSLIKCKC
jgi:hypothetical protein